MKNAQRQRATRRTTEERCAVCDRPPATDEDSLTFEPTEGEHLCWRAFAPEECESHAVDWRARYLEAREEADLIRSEHLEQARLLGMSGERELALRAKLNETERELARLRDAPKRG